MFFCVYFLGGENVIIMDIQYFSRLNSLMWQHCASAQFVCFDLATLQATLAPGKDVSLFCFISFICLLCLLLCVCLTVFHCLCYVELIYMHILLVYFLLQV